MPVNISQSFARVNLKCLFLVGEGGGGEPGGESLR